jgi:hypothetical protein
LSLKCFIILEFSFYWPITKIIDAYSLYLHIGWHE